MASAPLDLARERLATVDSRERMGVLVMAHHVLPYPQWLELVGEFWTRCDRIGPWRSTMRRLLPREGPVPQMMTPAEFEAWQRLPDRLRLYRGCGGGNLLGASWTQDRDAAAAYPYQPQYRQPIPLLAIASGTKRRVLAVKLRGIEAEVVTFAAERQRFELLPDRG